LFCGVDTGFALVALSLPGVLETSPGLNAAWWMFNCTAIQDITFDHHSGLIVTPLSWSEVHSNPNRSFRQVTKGGKRSFQEEGQRMAIITDDGMTLKYLAHMIVYRLLDYFPVTRFLSPEARTLWEEPEWRKGNRSRKLARRCGGKSDVGRGWSMAGWFDHA
jgi:hypothetical protein